MHLDVLYHRLKSLTVFRGLLCQPVPTAAANLLAALSHGEGEAALTAWAGLTALLQDAGAAGLAHWFRPALCYTDNPWGRRAELGERDEALEAAARRDVETLSALAQLEPAALREALAALLPDAARGAVSDLPLWTPGPLSFEELEAWYRERGCGLFAQYRAFLWEGGALRGISAPDAPARSELIGYRRQREQVEENTRILLSGRRANNVLLFGDSGTGKSATVKSLLALPGGEELRLIEVEKRGVATLPDLMRQLGHRRQKFILFLDDLSFDKDDLNYSVLKTILEGGLEPRPDNVAIYATSNRRNLVRQTLSDRAGDEMDLNETIQEKTALADRFGLRVLYQSFPLSEYLELIDYLADRAGCPLSREELHAGAVRWDVRHPGRSPRTARQYVASLGL